MEKNGRGQGWKEDETRSCPQVDGKTGSPINAPAVVFVDFEAKCFSLIESI